MSSDRDVERLRAMLMTAERERLAVDGRAPVARACGRLAAGGGC